jgi:uncharacterized protein
LIRYRRLGKTDVDVSEIGFGGAPAGLRNYLGSWEPDSEIAREGVYNAIQAALEIGINYFDTAPGYGEGASERMFGEGLKSHRGKAIVATKVMGESRDEILTSLEKSLKNLQVDCIDVFQYHGDWYTPSKVDRILEPGGALDGMLEARRQGLVRFIGFTSEGVNGPAEALLATGAFDVMQICYNLIYQHPCDPSRKSGIIYQAEKLGTGIVTMRPLTSGIFQKWLSIADPGVEERVDLNARLLGFVLSNPMVDCAIIGMRTAEEVLRNVAASADVGLRSDLDQLHQRYLVN